MNWFESIPNIFDAPGVGSLLLAGARTLFGGGAEDEMDFDENGDTKTHLTIDDEPSIHKAFAAKLVDLLH